MFDEAKAELSAWQPLKSTVTNFLQNHWNAEYDMEPQELLKSFHQLGARMSVKLHFLLLYWDYFPKNGDFSKELLPRYSH